MRAISSTQLHVLFVLMCDGATTMSHLAETLDEERFCVERFGWRPVEYAEELGWMGGDVWFAHSVHVSAAEIGRMAATGTGNYKKAYPGVRIVAGGVFPDYELPDHTNTVRTLSSIQGRDPMILTLARGHF